MNTINLHPWVRRPSYTTLAMYMAHSKPQAWQERMLKIIESETPLPMNWKPSFPDFDSHLDEIGFIEEENEESFEPFEEE